MFASSYTTTTQEHLSDEYERQERLRVRKRPRPNSSTGSIPVIDLTIDEPDPSDPIRDTTHFGGHSVQRAQWHSSSPQVFDQPSRQPAFNCTQTCTVQERHHAPLSSQAEAAPATPVLLADSSSSSNSSTSLISREVCDIDLEESRGEGLVETGSTTVSDDDSAGTANFPPETQICYGMLCDIETPCKLVGGPYSATPKLQWDGSTSLRDAATGMDAVHLSPRVWQILTKLVESAGLDIQVILEPHGSTPLLHSKSQSRANRAVSDKRYNLSAILYGSSKVAEMTGIWLSQINMYLQMPRDCDRNVNYINPQCLVSDEEPPMTFNIMSSSEGPDQDSTSPSRITFEDLYTEIVYGESEQPNNMMSVLRQHQRQALTFMLRRENGWAYEDEDNFDVWRREVDLYNVVRYRNRISGHSQTGPPQPFQGGILADEMGLGKTCTMLSLISTNRSLRVDMDATTQVSQDAVKATLVIVPFSLIGVWNKQIRAHFTSDSLRTYVYHNQARQSQNLSFNDYDIVITTYNTVAHKWKRHKHSHQNQDTHHLFNVKWHRIVLDEAHVIRTKDTMNARAVCTLRSDRRWCITGTPIQNHLSDLYSLLHFLRIEPYENRKTFEEEVMRPLKHGDNSALQKVQALMKIISIRRPKRVVSLPSTSDLTEDVSLSYDEREHDERARHSVIEVIDTAMRESKASSSAYMSAFQRINDLRYICNHGVRPQRSQTRCPIRGGKEQASFADQLDALLLSVGETCVQCGTDLREEKEERNDSLSLSFTESQESGPLQLCSTCRGSAEVISPVPSTPSSQSEATDVDLNQPSSKIRALLRLLQTVPRGEKSAVFSYWTSTLNAVGTALSSAGVKYVYFHGSLSNSKRLQTLDSFAVDPSIQVILVSITCGGQGLDLTAANHAFLLEPQWNPMLEEQAMSRVHRIGQTKPVRLVRFIVRDTWEEKIRLLQESKRSLAGLVVDRRTLKEGDDGRKQLYFLRELVA